MTVTVLLSTEMKLVSLKAALFIFKKHQLAGTVSKKDTFREECVRMDDIDDNERYYSSFIFVPSTFTHFAKTARMAKCADAYHCQGVGQQSYETIFQPLLYDTNINLLPIEFAHSIGTES